jgi:hypothetical protein
MPRRPRQCTIRVFACPPGLGLHRLAVPVSRSAVPNGARVAISYCTACTPRALFRPPVCIGYQARRRVSQLQATPVSLQSSFSMKWPPQLQSRYHLFAISFLLRNSQATHRVPELGRLHCKKHWCSHALEVRQLYDYHSLHSAQTHSHTCLVLRAVAGWSLWEPGRTPEAHLRGATMTQKDRTDNKNWTA